MNKTSLLFVSLTLIACGDDDGVMDAASDAPSDAATDSDLYEFNSRFAEGSSVAYSGQAFRHLLIEDLDIFIDGLAETIDGDGSGRFSDAVTVRAAFDFYFRFDEGGVEESPRLQTDPPLLHETYGSLSSAKSLVAKLAGQDSGDRDHRDWSTELGGWSLALSTTSGEQVPVSPLALVDGLLDEIAASGADRANGITTMAPDGSTLPPHISEDGLDRRELLQKFLLGAIAFAQASDDYLDEGLDSPNTQDEDAAYTELEHAWDEGFGYFGAARDYSDYTTEEVGGRDGRPDWQGLHDSDGDGRIDLGSEYNFGASATAAKRDVDSSSGTRFATAAFVAFRDGRALIANAGESLTADERSRLEAFRDTAIANWELALAATAVHYLNEVLGDLEAMGTEDYDFYAHAKHFAELKGFALAFQFNPRSAMSAAAFTEFHAALGDAPVLDAEAAAGRQAELMTLREQLQTAFSFAPEDVDAW